MLVLSLLHPIQVFLHPKQELPQVRDLGFAIAPGVHALIAVRLNEVPASLDITKMKHGAKNI